jgi:hypothetical protein
MSVVKTVVNVSLERDDAWGVTPTNILLDTSLKDLADRQFSREAARGNGRQSLVGSNPEVSTVVGRGLQGRPEKVRNRGEEQELREVEALREVVEVAVNVYAIIIVLCISIDKSIIRTRSLRNTHSQETQHLSWETL